ncbi:unnamed protein product [Closterium sp. Yama58-4]|nr:unnamed protein product [Closterium sp. Yama58-4]
MASIRERDRGYSSARFASPVSDIILDNSNLRGISHSNRYSSGRDSRSISAGRNAIGAIDRPSRRCSRYGCELENPEAYPLDRSRSGPLEAAFDLFESQARRPRSRPSTSGELGGARVGAHEISAAVGANGGNTATGNSLLHRRRLFRHNSAAFIRTPPRAVGFLAFQSSNGSPCPSPSPTGSAAALAAPSPTSRSRLLQRLRGKSESPARESPARNSPVSRIKNGAIPLSRSVDASAPFPAEQESRSIITRVRSGRSGELVSENPQESRSDFTTARSGRSGGRRMQAIMSVASAVNTVASSASDAGANVASIPRSGSSSGNFPRVARVPSSRNVANVAGVASVASIASLASLGGSSSEFSVSTIKSTFAGDGTVAFSRSSSNSSLTTSASVANYSFNSAATGTSSFAASLSTSATRADVTQTGVSLRDVGRQQAMRDSEGQRLGRKMRAPIQLRGSKEAEADRGAESLAEGEEGEEGEEGGAEVAADGGTEEESEEWGDLEEFADVECSNWQDISVICQARDAEGVKLLFVDIFVADVTPGLLDVAGSGSARQQEPPPRPSRSQIHVSYHITFPDHSSPASAPPISATEFPLSSAEEFHSPYRSPHMDSTSKTSRFDSPNRGRQCHTPSSTTTASPSKSRTPSSSSSASSSASASYSSSPLPSYSSSPSSISSPTAALMRFQSALFSNSPCSPLSSCWSSSSPAESPRNSPREYQQSSPGEGLERPGLSPATPGKIMRAYQRREKGEFEPEGCVRRTSGPDSPALAAVAFAAPTLAGPPSPLLAASVLSSVSPRASSPSKIWLSASGSGSSGGPVLVPSRFREGPRRADLDSPVAESSSITAVAGNGLPETTRTTLEPVDLHDGEVDDFKGVIAPGGEELREGSTKAPSVDCAREPAAADAADPSSHDHSSHKHSSHKSSEKEILSELLSIADIPVASHKSSSSSHHHSRRHAAPATVVDPMHLKTASQHLKAARQQQIVESDASDSATGSSPPKPKIRNRVAASTNANATLDSFLTTPGNQADGENPASVGDNGVTNVSVVEDMMFPSYSDHAKPEQVGEAVADVAGLKIQDATGSATSENDAPNADTSEKSEMRKSNSVNALENADKKPHPRGSVNVETSEVLAAMRVWGANRGAANAAGNADSVFMQPYQGSSYSSYIDDHKTSPRVSSDAPAREEPAKLERSRSKSYPELAELAKSAAVPKIKPLGGMRSGEKSGGKAAVMDKLGVGQEDSEYADTEYFGWLLSGGSKFAKPASTRQDPEDQFQEPVSPNIIQNAGISLTAMDAVQGESKTAKRGDENTQKRGKHAGDGTGSGLGNDSSRMMKRTGRRTKGRESASTKKKKIILQLRQYQQEVLQVALERNTIVYLETGMGKTLIAVMLMQARRQMREKSGKICVFLVPAVALVIQVGAGSSKRQWVSSIQTYGWGVIAHLGFVFIHENDARSCLCIVFIHPRASIPSPQQAAVVEQQTDMRVGKYSTDTEIKYEATWVQRQVSRHEVLVMTPQVLVNLLQHAFLSLSSVDLLIFDECHHTAKDHAYATIMKTWYFSMKQAERPLIFGMTASPINTKGSGSEESCVQQLLEFERILDSKLYTVLDRSCLVEVLPSAQTIQSHYDPPGKEQEQQQRWSAAYGEVRRRMVKRVKYFAGAIDWCLTDLGRYPAFLALHSLRSQAASGTMDQHEENARLQDAFAAVRLEFINRCESFLKCGLPPEAKAPGPDGLEATLALASHPSALLTPKIAHLLSLLRLYASQPSPTIVIFVERIVTAHSLSRLLRLLPSVAGSLRADFVVGAGAAKIGISTNQGGTAKHSRPDSAISRFRAGKLNVLVATSAAEEGMDIPACHTVIRFDRILTVRSMLQSRGRARKPGAHFRVLVQRGDGKYEEDLDKFMRNEGTMQAAVQQQRNPQNQTENQNRGEREGVTGLGGSFWGDETEEEDAEEGGEGEGMDVDWDGRVNVEVGAEQGGEEAVGGEGVGGKMKGEGKVESRWGVRGGSRVLMVPSTGSMVTRQGSVALVYQFCNTLGANDGSGVLQPFFSVSSSPIDSSATAALSASSDPPAGLFTVTLRLPATAGVPAIHGPPCRSKIAARRAVCLLAVKILLDSGRLSEWLLPIRWGKKRRNKFGATVAPERGGVGEVKEVDWGYAWHVEGVGGFVVWIEDEAVQVWCYCGS